MIHDPVHSSERYRWGAQVVVFESKPPGDIIPRLLKNDQSICWSDACISTLNRNQAKELLYGVTGMGLSICK